MINYKSKADELLYTCLWDTWMEQEDYDDMVGFLALQFGLRNKKELIEKLADDLLAGEKKGFKIEDQTMMIQQMLKGNLK